MPLMNSMGVWKQQKQTGVLHPENYLYFNATNVNNGAGGGGSFVQYTNNSIYEFGNRLGNSGNPRSYIVKLNFTGNITNYKEWEVQFFYIMGFCVDTLGNQHVLFKYQTGFQPNPIFRLLKFDSSDNLLLSKEFTFPGLASSNIGTFGIVIDSLNNLYIGTFYNAGHAVTKIDCLSYNVSWSKYFNYGVPFINQNQSFGKILIDGSNNTYVSTTYFVSDGSGGYIFHRVFISLNSSGTLRFSNNYTGGGDYNDSCIDSSGNVYTLSGNVIYKFNNSGTLQYQKSVSNPEPTVADSYYTNIAINSNNNVVLTRGGLYGWYVVTATTSALTGVTNTSWQLANGWQPEGICCDNNNTYVIGSYNNGTGGITPSIVKSNANGTTLSNYNNINFSQGSYTWSGTLFTTTLTPTSSSTTSTINAGGGTLSAITITSADITQTLYGSVPTMYAKHIT